MDRFWDFAKLLVVVGAVLLGLVLILLALPGSRFRKVLSTVFFAIAGLLGIYIVSPLDLIPDLIPVLGQVDDVLASILAIISAISGIFLYMNNRQTLSEGEEKSETDRYLK
jgi:uncharacterized membrane protein YkvA (DUF1232 family)